MTSADPSALRKKHERFHLRDLDALREELQRLQLELPIEEDTSILGQPITFGRWQVPNRFVALPMEGFDSEPDGGPGELCFRRYLRYARGGAGLVWFEATAILDEARSNPRQLWLNEANAAMFARLVEATREAARDSFGHEIVMVIQLTHSGRYSKPTGVSSPVIAHHSQVLDPIHGLEGDYPLITDGQLDDLQQTYVSAAKLARQAGFDGVDIKSCHRYLISELLASHTRQGRYGGSLENRSRMLLEVIGRIREEVPGVFTTTRMNVYDAIPHPWGFGMAENGTIEPDLSEPVEIIRRMRELDVPLVNVSIGNPYYNPHFGRPYDHPVTGVSAPQDNPLAGVVRFAEIVRQVQQASPELPIVGGGYSWLRHLMPYVAAGLARTGGVTLIGQGRGSFAYPDSVKDILQHGKMDPQKACITCSGCTQIMRDGAMTGCVIRDAEIYGEQYKIGRRYARDYLREQAQRCRDCEFPTCSCGCPAAIDIPRFIRAFADGDIPAAYETLRAQNLLPEMCGYVCPAEVQCEGECIERVFSDCSVPIRDIQMIVSREARRMGLVGARVPERATSLRVSVVGGGPAGIACAVDLVEAGHSVTLIDRSERLGGTPDAIIPEQRYQRADEEIAALLDPAVESGRLELRLGCSLGEEVTLNDLKQEYDAVFLGLGLDGSVSLGQADGVWDAADFLRKVKQDPIQLPGDRIAVLGGGNTAMDAAMTAKNLGAEDVYVVYRRSFAEMPAWPEERDNVLHGGCHILVLTQPLGYETDSDGGVTGLRVARTELGQPDDSGRRRPVIIEGTESVLPVDAVIEAMGQNVSPETREALGQLELDGSGCIVTGPSESTATSIPGVFAGGDIANGGTTAVQGIREGMHAAGEIDNFLRGENDKTG